MHTGTSDGQSTETRTRWPAIVPPGLTPLSDVSFTPVARYFPVGIPVASPLLCLPTFYPPKRCGAFEEEEEDGGTEHSEHTHRAKWLRGLHVGCQQLTRNAIASFALCARD